MVKFKKYRIWKGRMGNEYLIKTTNRGDIKNALVFVYRTFFSPSFLT